MSTQTLLQNFEFISLRIRGDFQLTQRKTLFMNNNPTSIIDSSNHTVAILDVSREADRFEGTIQLTETPAHMLEIFKEFEEIVEGQILSLLDDVEAKVNSLSLRVRFKDESVAQVTDLQVYPGSGTVSFKTRQPLSV